MKVKFEIDYNDENGVEHIQRAVGMLKIIDYQLFVWDVFSELRNLRKQMEHEDASEESMEILNRVISLLSDVAETRGVTEDL